MKKFLSNSLLLILTCFITSCASSNIALSENSPVALISVVGNKSLPWMADSFSVKEDDDSDGLLSNAVNKLIDKENPELLTAQDRIDYLEESFRKNVEEIAECTFLDKETVLTSKAYKKLGASYYNFLVATVEATDYKDLTTLGAKNARMFMNEIGAKGLFLLSADFKKKNTSGNKWNGSVTPAIQLKVKFLNEKGKAIINKTYEVVGTTSVEINSRNYDKEELVVLYPELIDTAVRKFALDYISDATSSN